MSDIVEVARIAAPLVVSPFVSAVMETRIKPMFAELFAKQKVERQLGEQALSDKFEEYLARAYERQSYITTVVFQNQRKQLKDLYQPLTVNIPSERGGVKASFRIDTYAEDFIPTYRRLLLIDTAGMGKSTLLRFLFLGCLEKNAGVPIFIELRRLSQHKSILDVLYDELNPINNDFDKDFILSLVSRGEFVFFFDGYDEIATDQRPDVTRDIQDFVSKAPNNLFVLSSRPEQALGAFNNFQSSTIRPLDTEEAYELIRRYAEGKEIGEQLISKLEEPSSSSIHEFLENPLLVSLLFKSYEYKQTLPLKKPIFYRQVYDALYETHDITKGDSFIRRKHSGLDSDEFHRVLRALGFLMFRAERLADTKDPWLKYIAEAKTRCPGLDFKVSDFFLDLTTTVPLVARDGQDYKWSHKSIQEYFAAQFICLDTKGKQADLLRHLVASPNLSRKMNLLDLCYDTDYKAFRDTIVYDLIQEFIDYCEQCPVIDTKKNVQSNPLSLRGHLCFLRDFVIYSNEYVANNGIISNHISAYNTLKEHAEEHRHLSLPLVYTSHSNVCTMLVESQEKIMLFSLLFEKRSSIVSDLAFSKTVPSVFSAKKEDQAKLLAIVEKAAKDGVFIASKSLISHSNNIEIEQAINDFLAAEVAFSDDPDNPPYILNLKECIALKSQIEVDINREAEEGFLLSGF